MSDSRESNYVFFLYLTCSGVVALFLFMVQQVHTQPLVTTTNNITSIPTSTPKAVTITFRLSLSSITLLICADGAAVVSVLIVEVGTSDVHLGQSVFGIEGLLVAAVQLITVVLGQCWHTESYGGFEPLWI